MRSIRKFVGYAGAAAGIAAALTIAMSTQTGIASTRTPSNDDGQVAVPQITVSADCVNEAQLLRTALIGDVQEDKLEFVNSAGSTTDPAEDAQEVAALKQLVVNVRNACLPTPPPVTSLPGGTVIDRERSFVPTSACQTAIANLKATWAQGHPTTQGQWLTLQSAFRAARAACGTSFHE
ncbi:MAG TPA: hypothetical protein VNA65_02135 [Candidatus Dormibacteraeota bacterium]|nr:hypothetical protein [Candidatus Dormibacteraeota bacterium]